MKILYIIPPSEWKTQWWISWVEKLSFELKKPLDILKWVTEKDLKCSGKRFEEAKFLHQKIFSWEVLELMPAIERYSGVMYSAIHYNWMHSESQKYFDTYFLIISWLYGLLRTQDFIANYKLPVEAKWIIEHWRYILPEVLQMFEVDFIIDLLPISYKKMIDWKSIQTKRVEIEFLSSKNWKISKLAHWVKKAKGEYIKNICNNTPNSIEDFPWNLRKLSEQHWIIEVYTE